MQQDNTQVNIHSRVLIAKWFGTPPLNVEPETLDLNNPPPNLAELIEVDGDNEPVILFKRANDGGD